MIADGGISIGSKATRIHESICPDAFLEWIRADSCTLNLDHWNGASSGYGPMDKVVDDRKFRSLRRRMCNVLREMKMLGSVGLAAVIRWCNKARSQEKTDSNGNS